MNEEEKQALEECKILMICLYDFMSIEKARFYCNQYKIILELIEKQQKEIEELKHFKKEVTEIIKYADDTAEPTYWNIRKLLGLGE